MYAINMEPSFSLTPTTYTCQMTVDGDVMVISCLDASQVSTWTFKDFKVQVHLDPDGGVGGQSDSQKLQLNLRHLVEYLLLRHNSVTHNHGSPWFA